MRNPFRDRLVVVSVVAVCLVTLVIGLYPGLTGNNRENLFVQQADAFLNGRLHILEAHNDVATYEDKLYVPFPPMPAVVLLPFVALFGMAHTNVCLISVIITVGNVLVLRSILRKLPIDQGSVYWVIAAFFGGTGYWLSVNWSHGVWFFAHVVAVSCMLLGIREALDKGRGLVVGLFLGMSVLSRQLSIYSGLFLLVLLLSRHSGQKKFFHLFGMGFSLAACAVVYLLLNWARFGDMFDTGYSYIYAVSDSGGEHLNLDRVERYGLFHPVYLPTNFVQMFMQGFHIEFGGEFHLRIAHMNPFGTSLTFASPFVFLAFKARWTKSLLWAAWLTICLATAHMLLYHTNGWVQSNAQRYALDMMPVLIVLVALGIKQMKSGIWRAAILYSVILNAVALVAVPVASMALGVAWTILHWD